MRILTQNRLKTIKMASRMGPSHCDKEIKNEYRNAFKGNVFLTILYLGELVSYPRLLHDKHLTFYRG
ncbi:hypothetical protein ECIAI39_2549 [Escherichia coli IAI39]|uniref:Uncharacterized protein n=1 Tax=Escherichia coli O7:K1 (strain IAI39 / ExPEC) TaxID=585057 RepID=A0A0H3MIX8_ECO7I|nr:hypothetical protein ECIAI39_2549 [Escherichia coli IAI39]